MKREKGDKKSTRDNGQKVGGEKEGKGSAAGKHHQAIHEGTKKFRNSTRGINHRAKRFRAVRIHTQAHTSEN